MFSIHVEKEIAVMHQLKHHEGKCQRPHGHNLLVEVDITAKELIDSGSSEGMVIDFGDIKSLIDRYDHQNLNSIFLSDALSNQPTAERLAKYFSKQIYDECHYKNRTITKIRVRVHEARGQYVEYTFEEE